jgi:two-component system, LytTR family, sensor kinase
MKAYLWKIVRTYLWSISFWCGIALLMGLQYRPLDRQHFWAWLSDLMIQVALRGLALAFWTPPIFYLVGKYLNVYKNRFRYTLFWSLGAVPFVFLYSSIFWALVPPYDSVLQKYVSRSFPSWVEMIRSGFADQIFIYIAIVVAAHAYQYLNRLRKQERERYEYQQALAASELQVLKMQIHPHFLFNTLHGIATLIDSEPKTAKAMIVKLSSLLRTALDRDSSDLIPLKDELRLVQDYLDLEIMRFGSRLKIEWSIAPGVSRLLVPQMLLQPLVENAVRHGVAPSREGGWIEISASAGDGLLVIQIRNSVAGKTSNGTGVGLRNAEARLKHLYSGDASLRLTFVEDHDAVVRLSLPALNSQRVVSENPNADSVPQKEDLQCVFSSSMTSH